MATKTKIIIGILTLIILTSGVIYIDFSNEARLRVDEDKITFYIPHPEFPWLWTVSGREYNRLFDGTTQMNRRRSSINITQQINGQNLTITRTTDYIRGPKIIDTITTRGDIKDIELFPISHTIEIFNGSGFFYRYTVDDLSDTGGKRKLDGEVELSFGRNMKVTLHPDYRWAWIGWPYGYDSVSAQYDIKSDYEIFNVRLFDPKVTKEVLKSEEFFNNTNLKVIGDKLTFSQLNNEVNLTMYVIVNGIEIDIDSLLVWWTEDKNNSWKFASNISIPNTVQGGVIADGLEEIGFKVNSSIPLESFKNGFRYLESSNQVTDVIKRDRYVYFDFSDILGVLTFPVNVSITNLTTKKPTGDNITVNKPVSLIKETSPNGFKIGFDVTRMTFSRGQVIELDPEIIIDDVNSYSPTVRNNVTSETFPLSHITLNDSTTVLYFSFDINQTADTDNRTFDYSVNDNHGSVLNGAFFNSTGFISGAYSFAGAGEHISVPNDPSLHFGTGDFTMVAWVNVYSTVTNGRIINDRGKGGAAGYQIKADDDTGDWGFFDTVVSDGSVFTGCSDTFCGTHRWGYNTWIHIGMRWEGGTDNLTLFANGTGVFSILNALGNITANRVTVLGTSLFADTIPQAPSQNFNGLIDEVMIFNRTLSTAEISDIYNNQTYRYLTPATQLFENINITDATENRVNVTYNASLFFKSSLQLRIREIDTGLNTSWQNLTGGDNQLTIFNISDTETNITLEFNFSSGSNNFYSPILRDTITVDTWNDGAVDNEFPLFFNFFDDNGSIIDSGTANFNVTLNNTNGTVFLDIDGSNRTAFNDTGNVFNISVVLSSSGVFQYNWLSFGNGTDANQNTSANRFYTVNSSVCTPPGDADWFIDTENCVLDGTNEDTGDFRTVLNGFNLSLINGANLTTSDLENQDSGITFIIWERGSSIINFLWLRFNIYFLFIWFIGTYII